MTLFDRIYEVWKEYFEKRIVMNPYLIKGTFHSFIGCVSNIKFIFGGNYYSIRVPLFIIQSSGTGKGQALKSLYYAINFLKIPSTYTTKLHEASLVGTMERVGRNVITTYGQLNKDRLICFDEGEILFKPYPYLSGIREALNMALDEPGWVSKGMRLGKIEYPTNCTIAAASIPTDNIKEKILSEGFIQRFFLSYKEFELGEVVEMDKKKGLLTKINYSDIKKLLRMLGVYVERIRNLEKFYKRRSKHPFIKFERDFNNIRSRLLGEYFLGRQFADMKQDVLFSFSNRTDLLIRKIAVQHAFLNEKNEVDEESYKYACRVVDWHCKSVLNLLTKYSTSTFAPSIQRSRIIRMILRSRPMSVTELLQRLRELQKDGRWDLGRNNTLKLVHKLIKMKVIKMREGEKKGKGRIPTILFV